MGIFKENLIEQYRNLQYIPTNGKFGGWGVELVLAKHFTRFNIRDIAYAHRSKKLRSNEIRVREGGNLTYRYVGKLLTMKTNHDKLNTKIRFRNVLTLVPFEISMAVYSPAITVCLFFAINKKQRGKTAWVLRKQSPSFSQVDFNYVVEDLCVYR